MYTHNSPFMCSATYYFRVQNTIYNQRYDMAFSRSQQHGWNPKATLFTLFTSLVLLSWIYIYIYPCHTPRRPNFKLIQTYPIPSNLLLLSSAFYSWKTFIKPHQYYGFEYFERASEFVQPKYETRKPFFDCIGVRSYMNFPINKPNTRVSTYIVYHIVLIRVWDDDCSCCV